MSNNGPVKTIITLSRISTGLLKDRWVIAEEEIVEETAEEPTPDPNRVMTPEEIANLVASQSDDAPEESVEVEEPVVEEATEEVAEEPTPDPNRVITPEEIANLVASQSADEADQPVEDVAELVVEEVAEIAEDSEAYVAEIEEAADILAGDPEIDLAIDVTEELNKLETEMLLEQGGDMPEIPADDLQYIPEYDLEEEEAEIKSKDKLKDEIDKLRKELES